MTRLTEHKYRLYGFVPYNISPIQMGIQFGHAAIEYALKHGSNDNYKDWATFDKTFIILNGGTTNNSFETPGSLNTLMSTFTQNEIIVEAFYEPDLGDQLTAFVFLVDDRVWDKKLWPDYDGSYLFNNPEPTEFYEWKMQFSDNEKESDQIVFLRNLLPQYRLA